MSLFKQLIHQSRMVPKQHYLHYYKLFLYSGMDSHHVRTSVDVIDPKMGPHHRSHLACMIAQVKYLHDIIRESRVK
jgi:hypothetical protein